MTTQTETQLTSVVNDTDLVSALVYAHGSVALAAERLHIEPDSIVARLPSLPIEQLTSGIKAARLLQAFDAFTVMKDVLFTTLPDMTADSRAKFMLQFMDRFETMLNPPVQSEHSPTGGTNIQFNLGSPEAENDARANLAKRIFDIKARESGPDRSIPEDESGSATYIAAEPSNGSGSYSPL